MPALILFRHGKSDWNAEYGSDRDRPLARRGTVAARKMGRWLGAHGLVPDRALTSPARRARDTVELASQAGGWQCPIEVRDELYGSAPSEILDLLRRESDSTERLLLTGHEPTWSQLASLLVGGGSLRMPTGAMVGIEFAEVVWSEVDAGLGRLVWLQIPRLTD